MEYISQKLTILGRYLSDQISKTSRTETIEIKSRDIYLEMVFKVLKWEEPNFTLAVFLILNFLFWLIMQLQIQFFGVIFFIVLAIFICDSFFQNTNGVKVGEEYYIMKIETRHYLHGIFGSICALRKENPSSFCILMSIFFLIMSCIAKSISGYLLSYITLLAIFLFPLGYTKLPPDTKNIIKETFKSIINNKDVLAEEDLIPHFSPQALHDRDLEMDSITDRNTDSATNSLISGISMVPSFLDADDNSEEDLLPSRGLSATPGDMSSDSDSETKGIRFDSSHFNGDTSSDDDKFVEGMQFSQNSQDTLDRGRNTPSVSGGLTNFSNIFSNVGVSASGIQNLVSTAIQSVSNLAQSQDKRKNSSSDSEFEIINTEDVDDKLLL